MDHQIEDHIDIGAAGGEAGQTVDLEETGRLDHPGHGDHRRVEALGVPHHDEAPGLPGGGIDGVGLLEVCAIGFSTRTSTPSRRSISATSR